MKVDNVFVFHGTGGHSEENWFPWLRSKIESLGIEVIIPNFPTPEGQSLASWLEAVEEYRNKIGPSTVLIGHSLGGMFLLKLLETLDIKVAKSIFVASPVGIKPIKFYESDLAFCNFEFDWDKIRRSSKDFIVYHSDNDPFVDIENGHKLAEKLGVTMNFIPSMGHFNESSGVKEFTRLIEDIDFYQEKAREEK
jgi:predicted alpha/beta hydrolase family esterase